MCWINRNVVSIFFLTISTPKGRCAGGVPWLSYKHMASGNNSGVTRRPWSWISSMRRTSLPPASTEFHFLFANCPCRRLLTALQNSSFAPKPVNRDPDFLFLFFFTGILKVCFNFASHSVECFFFLFLHVAAWVHLSGSNPCDPTSSHFILSSLEHVSKITATNSKKTQSSIRT